MSPPVPVPHRLHMPTTQIGSPHEITASKANDYLERAHDLAAEKLQAYAGYPELQAEILAEAVTDVRFSDDVDQAAVRIADCISLTELYQYKGLTIKNEAKQPTQAYKIRGAANFILKNVLEAGYKRVVTASAGNHGQAVALVASRFGIAATIVLPRGAPKVKIEAIRAFGGTVYFYGEDYGESSQKAYELNEQQGGVYVPAFNHYDIMAGQGTVAKEIFDQYPAIQNMVVPVGGGGLLAGCARYSAIRDPSVKVYGAGIAGGSAGETAFQSGNRGRTIPNKFADGIAVQQLGDLTWPEIKRHARGVLTADELSVRRTIGLLSLQGHTLEGAGAVGIAAALKQRALLGKNTVVIATGGNIDHDVLASCRQLVSGKLSEPLTKVPEFSTI